MKICKWIGKHIAIILLTSIIYMLSFHISWLDFTGIYFYDGILRLLLVTVIVCIMEVVLRKKIRFDYKDICMSICVFLLANMVWLSLCVVSLDRSLSVFLLCYMEEYQEGISEAEIEEIFQDVFVEKYGMLDRRFDEQVKTGDIVYTDGKYVLTNRGKMMVSIFKTVGKLYGVDERFIEPEIEKDR